jgi:hypothetical protein
MKKNSKADENNFNLKYISVRKVARVQVSYKKNEFLQLIFYIIDFLMVKCYNKNFYFTTVVVFFYI